MVGRAELAHTQAATSPAARPIPRKPVLQGLITCSHRRGNPGVILRSTQRPGHPANPRAGIFLGL